MEILAALQKALPLLTRAVPMLEVFVASRNNTSANEELRASIAGMSIDLAKSTAGHQELTDAVAANNERLTHISADLARLRAAADEQASRLNSSEQTVAALARSLRTIFVLTGLTLLLCIGILLTILLHQRA